VLRCCSEMGHTDACFHRDHILDQRRNRRHSLFLGGNVDVVPVEKLLSVG
jgi:hypothetical protein